MVPDCVMWDASYMDDPNPSPLQRAIRKAVEESGKSRDHFDSLIQKRTGKTGKPIYDIDRGKSKRPGADVLQMIAEVFGRPLSFFTGGSEYEDDFSPADDSRSDDGNDVEIQEWDVAYGMGGGSYLDLPVTGTTHTFSREWLLAYTRADPAKIFLARGVGDSMVPTLYDSDTVIIDTSEREVRVGDKIWAVVYGTTGYIKRIRPMPDGSVKMLSDNPSVPPENVYDGELSIVGRVVAVVRKL